MKKTIVAIAVLLAVAGAHAQDSNSTSQSGSNSGSTSSSNATGNVNANAKRSIWGLVSLCFLLAKAFWCRWKHGDLQPICSGATVIPIQALGSHYHVIDRLMAPRGWTPT